MPVRMTIAAVSEGKPLIFFRDQHRDSRRHCFGAIDATVTNGQCSQTHIAIADTTAVAEPAISTPSSGTNAHLSLGI